MDTLDSWNSGPLVVNNYGGVAATASFSRGMSGEVTAIFTCDLPQGRFDAFFLRYDRSRHCVDLIAHLDLGEPYSLESSTPIPSELADDLDEAADDYSPDPYQLFKLMTEIESGLDLRPRT